VRRRLEWVTGPAAKGNDIGIRGKKWHG